MCLSVVILGFGSRYVFVFMVFLGFFNVYCLRVNFSVVLVVMVNFINNDLLFVNFIECKEDILVNIILINIVSIL